MRHHRAVAIAAVSLGALATAAPSFAATTHVTVVASGKPAATKVTLSPSSVKAGTVRFKIENKQKAAHEFRIAGHTSPKVAAGKTATLTVTLKKGTHTYTWFLPGHASAGTKGKLKVT